MRGTPSVLSPRRGIAPSALDEPVGKSQARAETPLATIHLTVIDVMVEAGKVEESVQHKNLDFSQSRVAVLGSLAPRHGETDGQIACNALFAGRRVRRRKREHICRTIDAAIGSIEAPDFRIRGQQYANLPAKLDC